MQYQQNFLPGSGSTGAGSGRMKPMPSIITPRAKTGIPKPETPMGTKMSVTIRNAPKIARILPEATRPRYM